MVDQQPNEIAVDRREETVVTHQPGYAATERSIRDVAAERRLVLFQITRIIWSALVFLEILLSVRFMLKLIGANAESGFAVFIYGVTGLFTAPFTGLLSTLSSGAAIFEITTLIAMGIYALVFWGIVRIIPIVTDRSSVRTLSRTTREQTPGGGERTTHDVSSG